MFYVDLEPKENKEIYNLQYLNNMKINVEPPYKKIPPYNVQDVSYGHSKTYCTRPYKCVKCGGNHMTTEYQKPRETPAKCALCSGQHTANYKDCTVYRDLQNAKNNSTNRKQQIPNRQTITQNNTNHTSTQHKIRTSTPYSQVLNDNNNNSQTDNIGIQMNTFLNEFKTMFSQLINQNSMMLSMLTTIINNKLNNGH